VTDARADADVVAAGKAAWARVRAGSTFSDWILIAKAISVGRSLCLKAAGANRPVGGAYNKAIAAWVRKNGLDGITRAERCRCFRLLENLPAVEQWRATLDDAQRRKFNSPDAVIAAWRRSLQRPHPAPEPPTSAIIWPRDLLTNARKGLAAALERYGSDTLQMTRACLCAALPDRDSIQQLIDYQPKPRATPPVTARPRSAAMVVRETAHRTTDYAA
jgi:hypothetical protein